MTSCCRGVPCEQMFKPRMARRSLQRYRKRGLDELEQKMVASAVDAVEGARVLEIGGGIGALQAELLLAGADTGEVVEIVDAYAPYARELAHGLEIEGRTTFVVTDVLEQPEAVEPADIVVLNRVVCCSPDGVELAAAAARLARRRLVLSYPRDVWWMRVGIAAMNAGFAIMRRSFRAFVHPPRAFADAAQAFGLVVRERGRDGPWEFTTFGPAA